MARDLTGKVIVITGASSGIGAATAVECAKVGMNVVLNARRADRLNAVADLAIGDVHVGAVLETYHGDRPPGDSVAEELVEPLDGAQLFLEGDRELVHHLFGRGVFPRNPNHQLWIRKPAGQQLDRDARCGDRAHHQHADEQHEDRDVPIE